MGKLWVQIDHTKDVRVQLHMDAGMHAHIHIVLFAHSEANIGFSACLSIRMYNGHV